MPESQNSSPQKPNQYKQMFGKKRINQTDIKTNQKQCKENPILKK